MSVYNVRLVGMEDINITKCDVFKKVNEHGYATICGYFDSDYVDTLYKAAESDQWVSLMAESDKQRERIIYSGRIANCEISYINGYHEVTMKIIADTFLMDLEKKTKVFQNLSETYEGIIQAVDSDTSASHASDVALDTTIGQMRIQYHETDWEFIKRLASEKQSVLIPVYHLRGIKYTIGLIKSGQLSNIDITSYQEMIDYHSYLAKRGKGLDTQLSYETYYSIRSRDLLELGDSIKLSFFPAPVYVEQVKCQLEGSQMIHEYLLKPEKGFMVPQVLNYHIIGASINGVVEDVKHDKVRVTLEIDGHQDNSKWFEYATVYSSKDGAGWYCMPEIGDFVRVYFPDANEDNAYVLNANHINKENKDPAIKFLRNPQGKEIIFAPTYIKISNNEDMYILLDDEKGILIQSNKDITIKSKDVIQVQSIQEKVGIYSVNQIELKQGNSSVVLDQDVYLNGKQVHIQ